MFSAAIRFICPSCTDLSHAAVYITNLLSIIPVIVFYLTCQKHIIKGVAAGAVKG